MSAGSRACSTASRAKARRRGSWWRPSSRHCARCSGRSGASPAATRSPRSCARTAYGRRAKGRAAPRAGGAAAPPPAARPFARLIRWFNLQESAARLGAGRKRLTMDIDQYMSGLGRRARQASRAMARASTAAKNRALEAIACAIERDAPALKEANARDVARARDKGLDTAFIDRLTLSDKALKAMVEGLRQVVSLPDPIGEIGNLKYRPSGIQVGQMRVPL